MYKNVIFDLDDTLVECGKYYIKQREKFVNYSHGRTDIPIPVIEKIFSGIDLACCELEDGFSIERFPRSFAATSAALDVISGLEFDERAAKRSYDIGKQVFDATYELLPNALETIQICRRIGIYIYIYTKGDKAVQQKKVHKSVLGDYIDNYFIYPVGKKNGDVLSDMMTYYKLNPKETILVGDSLRDDIGSANQAGIDSVWFNNPTKKSWGYETQENSPTHTITSLEQVLDHFPVPKGLHFGQTFIG